MTVQNADKNYHSACSLVTPTPFAFSSAPWLLQSGREREEKFEYDIQYMLKTVCNELRKKDKYKRGLITAETFNEVLDNLNLKYGSIQVDLIMRYCHVTDDGYVHYKYLLMEFSQPYKNSAVKDSVQEALCPSDMMKQDSLPANLLHLLKYSGSTDDYYRKSINIDNINDPLSMHVLTPEKSQTIRKLYAQWDRGMLKDHELFEYLKLLNIPISKEFERLICTYGPSRTLTFGKLMQCLHINDITNSQRKTRMPHSSPLLCPKLPLSDQKNGCYDIKRNPITWNSSIYKNNNRNFFNEYEENQKSTLPRILNDNGVVYDYFSNGYIDSQSREKNELVDDLKLQIGSECKAMENRSTYLKRLVCDYLDNLLPSVYFRIQLYKMNIKITNEIDSLIRQHDLDNQGNFRDFMKILLKNLT